MLVEGYLNPCLDFLGGYSQLEVAAAKQIKLGFSLKIHFFLGVKPSTSVWVGTQDTQFSKFA